MPVDEVDTVIDPLIEAYQRSYERITSQLAGVADDPNQWRKTARLREVRASVDRELTYLDREIAPRASQATYWANELGFGTGAAGAGAQAVRWDLIDRDAAGVLARGLYKDLLEATSLVDQTSKTLLRRLGRDEALSKMLEGRTAVQAGRTFSRQAKDLGVYAVTYSNGARHGLDEYAAMSMRTVTANAYNGALVDGAVAEGVKFFEIFDGPDCGLTFHEDPEIADGLVVDDDTARTWPISHPNCRRSFGPRPDVTSKEEADAARRSTTEEQRADQIAADRQRGLPVRPEAERAALDRSRARVQPTSKATQPHRTPKAAQAAPPPAPVRNYTIASNAPAAVRADVEAAMDRISARYPKLTEGVVVRFSDDLPGANGWVYGGETHVVHLNKTNFSNPTKANAQLKHSHDTGFKVKTPEGIPAAQYTTTHEMGHILHNRMGLEIIDDVQKEVGQGGYLGRVRRRAFDPEALSNFGDLEDHLSSYAAKNKREWFAESFTDLMLNEAPGPFGQALAKAVDPIFEYL